MKGKIENSLKDKFVANKNKNDLNNFLKNIDKIAVLFILCSLAVNYFDNGLFNKVYTVITNGFYIFFIITIVKYLDVIYKLHRRNKDLVFDDIDYSSLFRISLECHVAFVCSVLKQNHDVNFIIMFIFGVLLGLAFCYELKIKNIKYKIMLFYTSVIMQLSFHIASGTPPKYFLLIWVCTFSLFFLYIYYYIEN